MKFMMTNDPTASTVRLSRDEASMIMLCLRIAEETFRNDADEAMRGTPNLRIAEQFEKQRREARAMLDTFEEHVDT